MSIPVEYTPMSYSSLPVGKTFGPIKFIVEETSRARTLELLNANNLSGQKLETEFLLPSELWGLARVLSAYLGRLNEAILRSMRVRARLVVKPCEELTGTSLVARHWRSVGDLPLVTMDTEVRNEAGELVCKTSDDILLINEIKRFPFYHEGSPHIHKPNGSERMVRRKTYFRFPWSEEVWRNNIHTDEFARYCGYEHGLLEFIMYLDWALIAAFVLWPPSGILTADFKLALPVYDGETFDVVSTSRGGHAEIIRFVRDGGVRLLATARQQI